MDRMARFNFEQALVPNPTDLDIGVLKSGMAKSKPGKASLRGGEETPGVARRLLGGINRITSD